MVTAYAESFGMKVWIFRFVSILGPRYTHGHVFDFYQKLIKDPDSLTVLGNGHQKKSYLHVSDCINAIHIALRKSTNSINIFNLGIDGYCEVRDSIGWITNEMGLDPVLNFGTEPKGWIGDNPLIHLSTKKIEGLGWKPKFSIEEGVRDTVQFLSSHRDMFK
jgi:UDP-glucose 4-epimerase